MKNIIMQNYDKGLILTFVMKVGQLYLFSDEDGEEHAYTYTEIRWLSRLSESNRKAFNEIMEG